HRGAEVLELVGTGWPFDSLDHRHGPVVPGDFSDHRSKPSPFVERSGLEVDANMNCRAALFVEVKAVTRGASGQTGRERRRAAFEIRQRTAHRVGVDDDSGVAERDMLMTYRRLYGLIIDARIRHGDADLDEGRNGPPLEVEHRASLPQ